MLPYTLSSLSKLSHSLLMEHGTVKVCHKKKIFTISNQGMAYDHHFTVDDSYVMTTLTEIKTYIRKG